jgi:hypothetical protein
VAWYLIFWEEEKSIKVEPFNFEMTDCREMHGEDELVLTNKINPVIEARGTYKSCRSNFRAIQIDHTKCIQKCRPLYNYTSFL